MYYSTDLAAEESAPRTSVLNNKNRTNDKCAFERRVNYIKKKKRKQSMSIIITHAYINYNDAFIPITHSEDGTGLCMSASRGIW